MESLWQAKKQLEQVNGQFHKTAQEVETRRYKRAGGGRFEDRHKRVTTYLENELYQEIESLRERGLILNLTAVVNTALREYITNNHGGKK